MEFDLFKKEKEKDKAVNTVSAYISDLKQFFDFANKDQSELVNTDIIDFKNYLLNKKYKIKSINRKLTSIKRYVDYINSNFKEKIFVEIKLIKIQKQEYLDEVLEKSDFERLIRFAEMKNDKRAIALFYGLYLTGARVSEILQIKVEDVKKDEITIKGKGEKYRDLFIPDRLIKYFDEYLKVRKQCDSDKLFINITNVKSMDRHSVHNLIKKYAGLSKVKLKKAHAHSFRHLYCYSLIAKGLSIDTIADLAGHNDINTTKIYTKQTKNKIKAMIKDL